MQGSLAVVPACRYHYWAKYYIILGSDSVMLLLEMCYKIQNFEFKSNAFLVLDLDFSYLHMEYQQKTLYTESPRGR